MERERHSAPSADPRAFENVLEKGAFGGGPVVVNMKLRPRRRSATRRDSTV